MNEPETIADLVLLSMLKTRAITPDELWERYQKTCKRYHVLPLWGQLKTAANRLRQEGKLKVVDKQNVIKV